jgi:ribonucleoside-diphosphate reductase alpha chain
MATIPTQTGKQTGHQNSNQDSTSPRSTAPGLAFSRHFTKPGVSPYDEVVWELRDAIIQDFKGRTSKSPPTGP